MEAFGIVPGMRRRDVIALLCATALLPGRARAQSGPPRVGFVILSNPEPYWTFVREGLRDAGYVDGATIRLTFRTADGRPDVLARHVAELVAARVDVIMTVQTAVAQRAMRATGDIPIVFIAANPLETGIVTNLARPGGNVTGVSTTSLELSAKTLELMREILPSLRRVAALVNADDLAFGKPFLDQIDAAGRTLGIEIQPVIVRTAELDAAFARIARQQAQAVIVHPSFPRERVIALARRHRLPAIASNEPWAEAGALISYAAGLRDSARKAVGYVDRILKGARPGDLPVQQPTDYDLIVNRKTARALGMTVPPAVLLRADRVIE